MQLHRFKMHHGVSAGTTCGEARSAEAYVDTFIKLVQDEELSPQQIYNADESALYWRCMPHGLLTSEEENPVGFKEPQDGITVMACSNAAGTHRYKLVIIGKSQNPQTLKGVRILPVIYRSRKRAWMNWKIMLEWFKNYFVREAGEHCTKTGLPPDSKILLILDNSSAHPPAEQLFL